MRLVLRVLAGLASTLLLSLLALGVAVGFLLHSEQGSRWLFELAGDFTPGELRIDALQGRLSGPLELTGLAYRDGDLSLELGRLYLDWRPGELLGGRLHLLALELERGDLQLPPSQADETPVEPFAGLTLPLALILDRVRVTDFRVTPPGAAPVMVQRVELAAQAAGETVSIERLEADAFDARVTLNGELRLAPALPMDLQLDWRYRPPELPELAGSGRIVGDLGDLQISQALAAPLSSGIEAQLFELEQAPRWQAELTLSDSDLGAFVAAFPARIKGRLRASGTLESAQTEARLNLREPQLGRVDLELAANYANGAVNAQRLLISTPAGSRIEGAGQYTLNDALGRFDAELVWSALRWPLAGEVVQVQSTQGSLKIDGQPGDFGYRLALDALLPEQPPLAIEASGRGHTQGLGFEALSIVLPEGKIQGSGAAAWAPKPSWDLTLEGQGIDPGLFHGDFPGDLALGLSSQGRVEDDGPHARVQLARLEGMLREYPLNAQGDLELAGETLRIHALAVNSGASRLQVQGSAGATLALDWSLRADDLASLWPGLSGSLNGAGRLAGSPEAPQVQAKLDGSSLGFEEHGAAALALRADLDLGGAQKLDLALSAKDLKSGTMQWQALKLTAKGQRKAHHIALDLDGKKAVAGRLAIDAGLDEHNTWSGQLRSLALTLPDLGRWELEAASPFRLSANAQRLEALCLSDGEGRLCATLDAEARRGWKASLNAPAFPLAFFQPWLPPELELTGRSDLAADFTADAAGRIRGQADLTLPEGRLVFELRGDPQQLDFSGGALAARLDDAGARAELKLPLAGLGGIDGSLKLPGLNATAPDLETQALSGHLKARIDDLGLAELAVPQLRNVAGYIDAHFTLAGSLAKPWIQGAAELKEGALDVPELGLELRDLVLSVKAPDLDRLTLEGSVTSGDGSLSVQGETRIEPQNGFPTRLQVEGKDWQAVNIPEATVRVSPKLVILHDKQRSELDGEIRIPYGRIRPRELPSSALASSPDLVVVGGDSEPQEQADPRFHSKLRIVFGDQVSFEGFGLRADLNGDLLVIDEPGRPVIGRGRVGIVDGSYRAYGQDLSIERGYALFADSPVDNPGLDVQAQREAGDVTAGLRVSGTLKTPKLSLFSSPTMTQSEVVSYLLTGRAPGESDGSGVGISTALQAAGVGSLTSEAGRQLGLEELRVETGSSLDEASVVAGTYLSPRLYVQYVNELASRETKLRFRYDLNDRLQIQTETGRAQGVDLFYSIER